ncbi:hypothetical protein Ctob_012252 [Chrysochromulina tobinii]|uniref:Uncharacterized protein n=1 Tax=Chrysochromulina tobinii TaxID=1460289 RepID=A0A0M0JYS9_9EUKA|nr:hypothetical protein Ctob_012252 [Chrysochromulina tobinii]|eukprot:KOO31447.1 hypothetical protein Ctob_012252 [Chrysochromulina sp. CCMP291]
MKTRVRISTINCTEAYPNTDLISWAHPENEYKNHLFADKERNIDTSDEEYHGCFVVKEDKRSGCQGAAALIMCSPAGQIALGAPKPKTKSNGELTLCHNLNVVDAAARRALHGSPIFSEVTTELKEHVQAKLIEDGLLRDGGTIAAITERELRADTTDELRALAALLAARGFACMAGGQLILFLAVNEDMIDAEFKLQPRSLGNTQHGLEYLDEARWGRWRRYGPTEVVPTDSEQLNELKKVRAKNSAKGAKKVKDAHANKKNGTATEIEKTIVKKMNDGSAPAQPNPSPSLKPKHSNPACVCRLTQCAFTAKKVKEALANAKNGTATEIEKTIVKKMNDGCAPAHPNPSPSLKPKHSHPACVCRLTQCAFTAKKVKEAHANKKNGTATEIEKTIVKKMNDGSAPAHPNPNPSLMPKHSNPACVCRLTQCAFTAKKVKEAHANKKNGTTTEIEKTIVKKMNDGSAPAHPNPNPSLMPKHSNPACVCRLTQCAFTAKKVKEALTNAKNGTATEIEKTIVKKLNDGYKVIKDAHANVKGGKATEHEKAIVKKIAKGGENAGKTIKHAHANVMRGTATEREIAIVNKSRKGTHPGYVIQDENGDKRNARLHFSTKKPHFNINAGRGKTFYIRTGSSELVIGSRHTFKEHTFTVLHRI